MACVEPDLSGTTSAAGRLLIQGPAQRILKLDGERVQVARDGPEGVELALASGLPRLDGYEVGRRIRTALGKPVLLVALTGDGQEQDHRRSSEAGFDAHLVKPVSYDDLIRLLRPPSPSA